MAGIMSTSIIVHLTCLSVSDCLISTGITTSIQWERAFLFPRPAHLEPNPSRSVLLTPRYGHRIQILALIHLGLDLLDQRRQVRLVVVGLCPLLLGQQLMRERALFPPTNCISPKTTHIHVFPRLGSRVLEEGHDLV
jgi:hypothetical protein